MKDFLKRFAEGGGKAEEPRPADVSSASGERLASGERGVGGQGRGSSDELARRFASILERRQKDAAAIESDLQVMSEKMERIKELRNDLDCISAHSKSAGISSDIAKVQKHLASYKEFLVGRVRALDSLLLEFTGDRVVIGISGAAGVGKSQTMQTITGLGNEQIPAGSGGLPITAVRTEYVNGPEPKAEVTFRTQESFMREYVAPRVTAVCRANGANYCLAKFQDFESATYLNKVELDGGSDVVQRASLRELQQAYRSLRSFKKYLSGETRRIGLDEIARYNTYPTSEEIQREECGCGSPERLYLAVESIVVHCPFPEMGNAPVSLVDLPGLGELTEEAARAHVRDLDHRVDHICVIDAANGTRAHFSDASRRNLDRLNKIQPGVVHRSDLITLAVNEFEGKHEAAETLHRDIDANLNKTCSEYDRYQIERYSALDAKDVRSLFLRILEGMAQKLPELDKQKLAYARRCSDGEKRADAELRSLNYALERMRRSIPSPRELERKRVEELSGSIVRAYTDLGAKCHSGGEKESAAFAEYRKEVERIHGDVAERIQRSLMCDSAEAWERRAIGQKSHYEFYLNECDRLTCELVTAYRGLDVFYGQALEAFKEELADVFVDKGPGLREALEGELGAEGQSALSLVTDALVPEIAEGCLRTAFEFLCGLHYDFYDNALYKIRKSLDPLSSAPIYFDVSGEPLQGRSAYGTKGAGRRGDKIVAVDGKDDDFFSIKERLEDPSLNAVERTRLVRSHLKKLSTLANDQVGGALAGRRDYFNEYLANALSYFCYYLYRFDQNAFDFGVVEGIVRRYGDVLYGEDAEMGKDAKTLEAVSSAQRSLAALMSASSKRGVHRVSERI